MGALRGPGQLVAELYDAANVGARENFNAPGEFFFTLPATHPQVAVIEPFQTHFSFDIYQGEGWVPKLSGLMTDFDATEDEVVFYGTDYPGVLNMVQDERYDPTKPDLPTTDGGAKYVDKTISQVVADQLAQAKAQPNSPVGFITVGDVASMPERLTIHASFKNRLQFITGLLDSSRAGTGRKTRIVCERSATGTFKWRVLFAPGKVRDNLRFEYGGLVQGFQTIPYQGWATRVDAVGRTVSGAKTFFHKAIAPGVDESVWGAFPVSTVYQDLADLNDLRRRTQQLASGVSKQGKALRFGIRVGAFDIKDGWDITDDIPVRIKRGVVDTSRYGSGYWTIWGWVWQSYPDGHSDLDLVIGPREDATPLNPDLIPSLPIFSTDQQWQVGYGKPTSYGQPPIPTPAP